MSQTSSGILAESLNANGLTEDERYELLASEERRIALDVLSDHTATVELDELAVALAAESSGDDAVDRMKTKLHHAHLPKMAELGVVEYDSNTCLVRPTQTTP